MFSLSPNCSVFFTQTINFQHNIKHEITDLIAVRYVNQFDLLNSLKQKSIVFEEVLKSLVFSLS